MRAFAALAASCLATGLLAAAPARADETEPTFSPTTLARTQAALATYESLAAAGGWGSLPRTLMAAEPASSSADIAALRKRLAVTGDLSADKVDGEAFDAETEAALKRFQARHGLSLTGRIGPLTLRALNVPISARITALRFSLERLKATSFTFATRYVVVNIPGAALEAVADGKVERRHAAVVGRKDRPSPTVESRIAAINLNPYWHVPVSITKADILPKMQKDATFLARSAMRVIAASGQEVEASTIDWSGKAGIHFTIRQDPGPTNSLGAIRLDMPNRHAVFIHDTPKQELFRSDRRFHSSGCARVEGVRDLAAWLLDGSGWDRPRIDQEIESGARVDLKLSNTVPVAWVYLTGWGGGDGAVQFREDIYGLDTDQPELLTGGIKPRPTPVAASSPKPKLVAPAPVAAKPRPTAPALAKPGAPSPAAPLDLTPPPPVKPPTEPRVAAAR